MQMSLRVSIVPHVPLSLGFGGLEVQQEHTIQALTNAGVHVSKFDPWHHSLDADVLHVFGSFHHQAETVFRAVAKGIPVVVTSMFVRTRSPLSYTAAKVFDAVGLPTLFGIRRKLLINARRIVALSDVERRDIVTVFGVDVSKIDVLGNGVEDRFFTATPDLFRKEYGIERCVLCVASIEPNKNQLALIEAIGPTGIPLVLIGSPKQSVIGEMQSYADRVRAAVAKWNNVFWIEGLDHNDALLASAFAASHVHVLASLAEGQGISSLEASASGAGIIMSDLPNLRSIYGNGADYCQPHVIESIRRTVQSAWDAERGVHLNTFPNRRPPWLKTWDDVAKSLIHTYHSALST